MSLIDTMMEACVMVDKTTTPDGLGGFTRAWVDGANFRATIIKSSDIETREAQKQGLTEVYTVVTPKGTRLEYHDVFRRVSDGAIFRVTADNRDNEAPAQSTVQIGKVAAERWVLPDA